MKPDVRAYVILILLVGAVFGVYLRHAYVTPISKDITFEVTKGMGGYAVAKGLSSDIGQRVIYPLLLGVSGYAKHIQVGEYCFPKGLSLKEVFEGLSRGKYRVAYLLPVVEGMTIQQVQALLEKAPKLLGDMPTFPAEGMIYPDTYTYFKGDTRAAVVHVMRQRMIDALLHVWASRDSDCFLKNTDELVVLASIVEKETSVPDERGRVAGVYLTRLKKGIPLQADPTVVYGLSSGLGRLDRALMTGDLKKPTPYNTYLNKGLPPTAIAIPSLASLKAVAHPHMTGELYFVATGKGPHVFSKTLQEHQRHHQALRNWRQAQKVQQLDVPKIPGDTKFLPKK